MSKSQQPSRAEIRRGFRLIGEACEIGDDPIAWRTHLAVGLGEAVGARAAILEEEIVGPTPAISDKIGVVVIGIDGPKAWGGLMQYERDGGYNTHPLFPAIFPVATRAWTHTRRELLDDDRAYYGSRVISEYKRAADIDDTIHSRQPIPRPGWSHMVALFRGIRERPFGVRERRLVHLIHEELAHLWRRPAAPDPADALSPRLRQVVQCLRAGDGEKQVALRLGLRRHTVHAYVKQLYRRHEAASRVELLARLAPPRGTRRPCLSFESPPRPEVLAARVSA